MTETFEEFRARREQERAATEGRRVTWRRVSEISGGAFAEGGWSGYGPHGCLCYVRPLDGPVDLFEFGIFSDDPPLRLAKGSRSTLRAAKEAAARELLSYVSEQEELRS